MDQYNLARNVIESQYDSKCDVIEHQKYLRNNKSTGFEDITVYEKKKCKLSFENISSANSDDIKNTITQIVKLFIAPEIKIKEGSRIDVTNFQGITISYKRSSIPAVYPTHQEIILVPFDKWA